jgi:hypothetical protein
MKPSRETLDAAIADILSAPKDGAVIEQLCFRPDFGERTYVNEIAVTAAGGVDGCRWSHTPWLKNDDGTGNPDIQVSILQKRVLDLVYEPGGEALHPGDTLMADMDLSEENLPIGTIIKAGTAQLRVGSHWNNACVKWKVRYGADALDWVREEENIEHRLRGEMSDKVTEGVIKKGGKLMKV